MSSRQTILPSNLRKGLNNPTLHLILVNFYKAACVLIINKIAAIRLDPENYGIFGQFLNISAIFNMVSSIGLGNAIIRDISSNPDSSDALARTYLRITTSVSIFFMAFGVILCLPLSQLIFHDLSMSIEIAILSGIMPLLSFSNFFSFYYSGKRRQTKSAFLQFISFSAGLIIFAIIGVHYNTIESFSVAYVIFLCLPAIAYLFADPIKPRELGLKYSDIKFFAGDTLSMFGAFLILPLTTLGIRSDLAASHSWSSAAILQVVTRLSDAYMQIFGIYFSNNVLPNFSRGKNFALLAQRQVLPLSLMMLFFGVAISIFYDPIVAFLFSPNYTGTIFVFIGQYLGDFIKILILIFSYFYISRKMFTHFLFLEMSQGVALATIYNAGKFLGIKQGAQSVTYSYATAMLITMVLAAISLKFPLPKGNK